jgi:GrpB-like predicted nucleotidyltransferase (UPF0157 family)
MPIRVVPYDPSWPHQFARIRVALAGALQAVPFLAIEHVGSTCVPGLAAKPVIDVDVVVLREHLTPAIEALVAAGYQHEGDLGIRDRHAMRAADSEPERNVYVAIDGSLALRNHLAVRDVLRSDAPLREEYERLKLDLARRHADDMGAYVAAKTELLGSILARGGITDEERAEIAAANRA